MLTDNYKNFIISTVTQNNSGVVNIVTINYSKKTTVKKSHDFVVGLQKVTRKTKSKTALDHLDDHKGRTAWL